MGKKRKKYKTTITLQVASKEDLVEIDRITPSGKKIWKLREGLPFWLINSKGEIENRNYILSNNIDKEDLGLWMLHEQLLIPKKIWKK